MDSRYLVRDRQEVLTALRDDKMASSSHAFVRGCTKRFYELLKSSSERKIPQGPAIWICGDCHIGNLGPIANAKGEIEVQIRDFDQTVIGNPAHDLIRLGLSLASAARGSDLPGIVTVQMVENLTLGYESAFLHFEKPYKLKIEKPKAVRLALKMALARTWKELACEWIKNPKPNIPLGKRFWPLTKAERKEITTLFETEKVRRMVTALRRRDDDSPVKVLDAAFWVKGCSSLGKLRYAVLLEIEDEYCLIDAKEAVTAIACRNVGCKMPKDDAERVAQGAWHMSPALGNRMLAVTLQGRPVFLRELLPQDLKFEIERLSPKEAVKVAKYLAAVIGKAHARQMDAKTRRAWLAALAKNRPKDIEAPSWLWLSVKDLIVSHEGAYLDHCRHQFSKKPVKNKRRA